MAGIDFCFLEGREVVGLTVDVVESTAADIAAYGAISPFVLGMVVPCTSGICDIIMVVNILRYESLSHKDYNHHNDDLVDGLPDNVFEHDSIDDVVISVVRFAFEELRIGLLCCKSQRGQGIHDEVYP